MHKTKTSALYTHHTIITTNTEKNANYRFEGVLLNFP